MQVAASFSKLRPSREAEGFCAADADAEIAASIDRSSAMTGLAAAAAAAALSKVFI